MCPFLASSLPDMPVSQSILPAEVFFCQSYPCWDCTKMMHVCSAAWTAFACPDCSQHVPCSALVRTELDMAFNAIHLTMDSQPHEARKDQHSRELPSRVAVQEISWSIASASEAIDWHVTYQSHRLHMHAQQHHTKQLLLARHLCRAPDARRICGSASSPQQH